MIRKIFIDSEWLHRVDGLLSCLLHRHASAIEHIGELSEIKELAPKARHYCKVIEALEGMENEPALLGSGGWEFESPRSHQGKVDRVGKVPDC